MNPIDEGKLADIVNHAMTFKFGGMSDNELMALGRACNEKNVLELGSMVGMSSYVIGSVAKHLDCIDVWAENIGDMEKFLTHDQKQLNVYRTLISNTLNMHEAFLNNCKDLISSKKIKMYRGKTTDLAEKFADKKYDVIFFDADHSYQGISRDFYAYEKKLKDNGLYLFHDYGDSMWKDISKFTEEMMSHNRLKLLYNNDRIGFFVKPF